MIFVRRGLSVITVTVVFVALSARNAMVRLPIMEKVYKDLFHDDVQEVLDRLFAEEGWLDNITIREKKPRLILHVGPKKTGSTTIQLGILGPKRQRMFLLQDNIRVLPGFGYLQVQKLRDSCFGQENYHNCDLKLLRRFYHHIYKAYPADAVNASTTSITSCETYSTLPMNSFTRHAFVQLTKHWDVRIILVYRRFSSWLPSLYTQLRKKELYRSNTGKYLGFLKNSESSTFPEFVDTIFEEVKNVNKDAYETYLYFSEIFGPERIQVVDMSAEEGMTVDFLCRVLNASHTCGNMVRRGGRNPRFNGGAKFLIHHDAIVIAAYRQGIIQPTVSRHEATLILQERMSINNFTLPGVSAKTKTNEKVLPSLCSSNDQLTRIWKRTLTSERALSPNPTNEEILHVTFEQDAKKFCSVDTRLLFEDEELRKLLLSPYFYTGDSDGATNRSKLK